MGVRCPDSATRNSSPMPEFWLVALLTVLFGDGSGVAVQVLHRPEDTPVQVACIHVVPAKLAGLRWSP